MKALLVNYNFNPFWLKNYNFEVTLIDRSDDGKQRALQEYGTVIYTPNTGNVDFDKLDWLIKNYDNLPDIFLWGKSNLFKYITKEEFDAIDKTTFQPLLTQQHRERDGISFYKDGMYHEKATTHKYASWIGLREWEEWAAFFKLPKEEWIPFAPGGNYILTKERVHRYPKLLYETMRAMLPYNRLPGEAHLCERSYYLLWRQ